MGKNLSDGKSDVLSYLKDHIWIQLNVLSQLSQVVLINGGYHTNVFYVYNWIALLTYILIKNSYNE